MFNLFKRRNMDSIKQACCDYAAHLGAIAAQGYHDAGEAFAGRIVFDEAKWITVHPNGKGYNNNGEKIKGTPILIDSESGAVLGGAGGKFTGKHVSEMKQRGANAIQAQHDIVRTQQKNADPEGFAKRQKELLTKRDQQVKEMQEAAAQKKTETERKAKEAQEKQTKEQAAAQKRAKEQVAKQEQTANKQTDNQQSQIATISRQAKAQKAAQAIADNPLPEKFSSNKKIEAYCRKAFPAISTVGVSQLKPEYAHDWLTGIHTIASKFPALVGGDGVSGFNSLDGSNYTHSQKLKEYNTEIANRTKAIIQDPTKGGRLKAQADRETQYYLDHINEKYKMACLIADREIGKDAVKKLEPLTKGRGARVKEYSQEELQTIAKICAEGRLQVSAYRLALEESAKDGIFKPKKMKPEDDPTRSDGWSLAAIAGVYLPGTREIWPGTRYFSKEKGFEPKAVAAIRQKSIDAGHSFKLKDGVSVGESTCVHEMAHALDFMLGINKNYEANLSNNIGKAVDQMWKEYQQEHPGKTGADIYALTNIHEFFAEHIAEALTGAAPSQRAKDLLKLVEQEYQSFVARG